MIYYKTSQLIPGKGDAWMYYECDDEKTVLRYVTFVPATGEAELVADPVVKTLYRPDLLEDASEEEFEEHWAKGTA